MTSFFDKILIKHNKSFSQLAITKLIIYKFLFKKPPNFKKFINKKIEKDLIISLTTMPSRIDFVKYTLNSLLSQTIRPAQIILNYDKSISSKKINFLRSLYSDYNIEFRLVENVYSHKKYLFLKQNEISHKILLCDDDMIHDKWFLKHIIDGSKKYPNSVVTLFGWKINFDINQIPLDRNKWVFQTNSKMTPNINYWSDNAYSLFPNYFFDKEIMSITNIKKKLKNLETNVIGYDDSWINFHRIKKKIDVVFVRPYSKLWLPAEKKEINDSLGYNCKGYWYEGEVFKRLIKKSVIFKK